MNNQELVLYTITEIIEQEDPPEHLVLVNDITKEEWDKAVEATREQRTPAEKDFYKWVAEVGGENVNVITFPLTPTNVKTTVILAHNNLEVIRKLFPEPAEITSIYLKDLLPCDEFVNFL